MIRCRSTHPSGSIRELMALDPGDRLRTSPSPTSTEPGDVVDLRGQTVVLYFYPKADT
jgi:peroxiredoxin